MRSGPWSSKEIKLLQAKAHLGAEDVAEELGRSVRSVQAAAYRYRVSLRTKGCTRGTLLGQPRGSSWRDQRTDLLFVDLGVLERRILTKDTGELCPRCTTRPAKVRSTGLCEQCHWKELTEQRKQQREVTAAKREYRKEQKRAQRRTACEACGLVYSPRKDNEGRKSPRALCPTCREDQS